MRRLDVDAPHSGCSEVLLDTALKQSVAAGPQIQHWRSYSLKLLSNVYLQRRHKAGLEYIWFDESQRRFKFVPYFKVFPPAHQDSLKHGQRRRHRRRQQSQKFRQKTRTRYRIAKERRCNDQTLQTDWPCCREQYRQGARERFRYDQKGSVSRQAECEYFRESFVAIKFVDRTVEYPHFEITRQLRYQAAIQSAGAIEPGQQADYESLIVSGYQTRSSGT